MPVTRLLEGGYYNTRNRGTGRTRAKLIPHPERTGNMTFAEWKAFRESYHIEVLKRMDVCLICRCKIHDDDRPVVVEYESFRNSGEFMICRYCYEHFDEYEEWRQKWQQGEFRRMYAWEVWFIKPGATEETYSVRVMHTEDEIEPQLIEQFGEGTKLVKTKYMGESRAPKEMDKFEKKYQKERMFRERDPTKKFYQKKD